MSYHLTILRTKNGVANPIDLGEVHTAIESLDGWEFAEKDTAFVKRNGPGEACILWHENGELWAKTPSSWALEQIITLADRLNARVRGDEYETYETIDHWYTHPDDFKEKLESERESRILLAKSLKEQRLIRAVIIGFFLLLGIAAYFIGASFEK